jgi:phage terminase small subunit
VTLIAGFDFLAQSASDDLIVSGFVRTLICVKDAKHTRFVAEYLVDLNGKQAAIRAGYIPRTAEKQGCRLLRNVKVFAAIAQGQREALKRLAMDADEAVRLNTEIARFDPIALVDAAGNYKPLRDTPSEARRCIRRIRVHKQSLTSGDGEVDRVIDYEFIDKHQALERDYKRKRLLVDRLEVHDDRTLRERMAAGEKRAKLARDRESGSERQRRTRDEERTSVRGATRMSVGRRRRILSVHRQQRGAFVGAGDHVSAAALRPDRHACDDSGDWL